MLRSGMNCETHTSCRKSIDRRLVTALGACVLSSMLGASVLQGAESWGLATRMVGQTGAEIQRAEVENSSGYRFSVERSAGGSARCSFRLPEGAPAVLDGNARPTFLVDALPLQSVVRWQASEVDADDAGDFMEVARRGIGAAPLVGASAEAVAFICWKKLKDQATPTTGLLRQLLDGKALTVQLRFSRDADEEVTFALEGARTAIAEALGISAEPSERDLAQDQLLQFRVHYRSTACYLFQGRKRQRRCLETVRECSLKSHDSVVSMLGCIEGN